MINITSITSADAPAVKVSDHAFVRYLERVKGIDVDKIKNNILSDRQKEMALFGDCKIKADKFEYIIKDQTLITVI